MLINAASFALHKEKGLTLIEVLVTVMILSIGLLGLAGMHFHGLKNNQSSYFRSQATILGYEILDSMRANKARALNGDYDISLTGQASEGSESIAASDVKDWRNKLNAALPSATGSIGCAKGTAVCTVTVQWNDKIGEGGSPRQQFRIATQL